MVTVQPLVLPQISRGNSLREYEEAKAKQKFLEYTTTRPASTAGPLKVVPPITPQHAPVLEDEDDEDGEGFFMTQFAESGMPAEAAPAPTYAEPPYKMPLLAPGENFIISSEELAAEAQRLGIGTPMSRAASSAFATESMGATVPGPDDAAYVGDEDFADDAFSPEDESQAIVSFVANLPPGVEKKYTELFREDTDEERALGPVKYVPDSIKASTQALRFVLQKPLTLVFDRKPVGGTKKNPQLALTSAGGTREWHLQNLEAALAEL